MGTMLLRVSVFLLVLLMVNIVKSAEDCYSIWNRRCTSGDECIATNMICDGTYDCSDGSDEAYCQPAQHQSCPSHEFQCSSGSCKPRNVFCNKENDCGDNSDEFYCDISLINSWMVILCPRNWIRCNSKRCIQANWKCDGIEDCPDGSDESGCPSASPLQILTAKRISNINDSQQEKAPVQRSPGFPDVTTARSKGIGWLLSKRKSDSTTGKWGLELHRIATALYLADARFFAPGNKTGDEMGYELTIQLLHKLSGNNTIRSQELALYIQALIVTCSDPRDFFGHNLVTELRRKVDSSNYTNPFEILALCNAKDNMTSRDIERVTTAYDSQYRPFWTDTQAIATMALQCLSSSPNVRVDERIIKDRQDELKKRQFRNGTVDNTITTALVVQALQSKESYKEYFDLTAAISVLKDDQKSDGSWGSIRNSYYILPAIYNKSYLNISSAHCVKHQETEEEALHKLQDARGDKFVVQYSVWIGNDVDLGRTWRVRMQTSRDNTFYDVIETVRKLDSKHNVTYNVIENKPYVSALYGKQDDPELGVYWFTYVRSLQLTEAPKLIESSPVDVKVLPKQELILWYKPGRWSSTENSN